MADQFTEHTEDPIIAEAQLSQELRAEEFSDVLSWAEHLEKAEEAEKKAQEDRRGLYNDTLLGSLRAIPSMLEESFELVAEFDEAMIKGMMNIFPDADLRFGIDPRDPDGGFTFFKLAPPESKLFPLPSIFRASEKGWREILGLLPETERLTGALAEPIGKFILGFVGASKALKGVKFLQGGSRAAQLSSVVANSAISDALVFDGHEQRLSDFLISFDNPVMNNIVTQYLASNEFDTELEGRLKNVLEGAGLGLLIDSFILGLRGIRSFRMNRAIEKAVKEADEVKMPMPDNPKPDPVGSRSKETQEVVDEIDRINAKIDADEVLVHEANTAEDVASILKDGFDEQRIGQSGIADFTDGFWFQLRDAGEAIDNSVQAIFKPGARVKTFKTEGDFFSYLSEQFGQTVTSKNYTRLVRDGNLKVTDEAVDAFRFGPDFKSTATPYDPGMVVVLRKDAIQVKPKAKEAPKVKLTEDELIVARKAELNKQVRATVQVTEEQQTAFAKALEDGDDEAAMEVLKDFNEDTIDWSKVEDADDIKQVMLATEKIFADIITKAKGGQGGVLSNKRLRMLANLIGANPSQVKNLHSAVSDGGGIAVKFFAAYRTMMASAINVKKAAQTSLDNPGSAFHMAEALRSVQIHAAIQADLKGAQTEIARAMQGMSLIKESAAENFKEFEALRRQFANSGIGKGAWEKQMDALLGPMKDPGDLSRFNKGVRMTRYQRAKNIFIEYTIGSMLSSPKTHLINFASNVLNTVIYSLDRSLGGSYRFLVHGDRAAIREARIDLVDKFTRMDEAWKLAKQAWRDGAPVIDMRQRIEFKTRMAISVEGTSRDVFRESDKLAPDFGSKIRTRKTEIVRSQNGDMIRAIDFNSWQRVINTIGRVVRIPGRSLITGDEFFKAINRNAEISVLSFRQADEEAIEKGLKYGTDAYEKFVTKRSIKLADTNIRDPENIRIQSLAIEKARLVTFQESPHTDLGGKAEQFVNANSYIKLIIAPFFRTPMNIIRQGAFDRTPIGLLFRHQRSIMKDGNPRDKAEMVARSFTGMGAMMAFYGLTSSGEDGDFGFEIVGKVPFGSSAQQANILDYSIRIGDNWYQFSRMEPMGMWLGIIADMRTASKYNDGDDDEWLFALGQGAFASFMNGVGNKTFMKSISDIEQMFEGIRTGEKGAIKRAVSRFSAGEFGKLIPQLFKGASRALEDDDQSFQQEAWTVLDIMSARSSLFNKNLSPRHDALGKLIPRDAGLSALINPFTISKDSKDPVYMEMFRLGFTLAKMPKTLGSSGFELSASEYSTLTGLVAKTGVHQALTALVTSEAWDSLTVAMKSALMKKQITEARASARLMFLAEPGIAKRLQEKKIDAFTLLISDE